MPNDPLHEIPTFAHEMVGGPFDGDVIYDDQWAVDNDTTYIERGNRRHWFRFLDCKWRFMRTERAGVDCGYDLNQE